MRASVAKVQRVNKCRSLATLGMTSEALGMTREGFGMTALRLRRLRPAIQPDEYALAAHVILDRLHYESAREPGILDHRLHVDVGVERVELEHVVVRGASARRRGSAVVRSADADLPECGVRRRE